MHVNELISNQRNSVTKHRDINFNSLVVVKVIEQEGTEALGLSFCKLSTIKAHFCHIQKMKFWKIIIMKYAVYSQNCYILRHNDISLHCKTLS